MSLELFIPLSYFWLWEWFTSSTYTLGECLELLNHSWYLKRKPLKIQWFSAVTHFPKSEFCHWKMNFSLLGFQEGWCPYTLKAYWSEHAFWWNFLAFSHNYVVFLNKLQLVKVWYSRKAVGLENNIACLETF